jgi:uncharacterized coiled-coil protein SlyX
MAWALAAVEPIAQYGHAAIGVAGVLLACFIMLAASALMAGWRFFNPLPLADTKEDNNIDATVSEQIIGLEAQLGKINQKLKDFARSIASSAITQDKRQDLLKETISTFSDRLSKVESVLRPSEKGLLAYAHLTGTDGTRLGSIEKTLDTLNANLDDQRSNHRQLHDKVWQILRAKQVLERVVTLMDKLEGIGEDLSAATSKKEVNINWDEWERQFKAWNVSLHELCVLIKPYLDVEKSLLNTPSEKYKSQYWGMTFDEGRFPNSDRVHDFKTFRILFTNLHERQREIMDAVRYEAFV